MLSISSSAKSRPKRGLLGKKLCCQKAIQMPVLPYALGNVLILIDPLKREDSSPSLFLEDARQERNTPSFAVLLVHCRLGQQSGFNRATVQQIRLDTSSKKAKYCTPS